MFKNKVYVLLVCISFVILGSGCKSMFSGNPQRKAEKQQAKNDKLSSQSYDDLKKRPYDIQTKETQKRMKKNLKKTKKHYKKKKKGRSGWECS